MAGILIYTAAPDSEGTLGGLVSLGETQELGRHLQAAFDNLELCASDPLCAESVPEQQFLSLHGSACHACLFAPGDVLRARKPIPGPLRARRDRGAAWLVILSGSDMDAGERKLIEAAVRFAAIAPADVVEQLASGICGRLAVGAARGARDAAQAIGNPRHRALAGDFVEVWRAEAPSVTASEAAMALLSAAATEQEHSRRQRIELVWTGPSTTAIPARQTGEFLAGMIYTARRTLTLSSFGVYPVPRIGEGLRAPRHAGSLSV